MPGIQRLKGKRALVTGAGIGIGREIALQFARDGADVALHYSHAPDGAESAAAEIHSMGRRALPFKADFNDPDAAAQVADAALRFLGGVDCLVNNAGISFNKPFLKTTAEQLSTLLDVNLRVPFLLTQQIVVSMLRQGAGTVCNIASIHGMQGAPEHSAYAATKGAIIAWTRSVAVELGHRGIRVNAIAPGWITTESYFQAIPGFNLESAAEAARRQVPAGRYGTPLDIAQLAAFLCSDEAGFITGQTIVADGGTTALMSLISDFRTESEARFGSEYMPGS